MAKSNSSSSKSPNTNVLFFLCLVFAFGFVYLAGKYHYFQNSDNKSASTSQMAVKNKAHTDTAEQANIISQAIIAANLLNQPKQLQTYVQTVSSNIKKDVVVTNTKEMILADTVPENIGTEYTEDEGEELLDTIKDGKTRTFVEKGADYPKGISQTVIAIKDSQGVIVGAVILSNFSIY